MTHIGSATNSSETALVDRGIPGLGTEQTELARAAWLATKQQEAAAGLTHTSETPEDASGENPEHDGQQKLSRKRRKLVQHLEKVRAAKEAAGKTWIGDAPQQQAKNGVPAGVANKSKRKWDGSADGVAEELRAVQTPEFDGPPYAEGRPTTRTKRPTIIVDEVRLSDQYLALASVPIVARPPSSLRQRLLLVADLNETLVIHTRPATVFPGPRPTCVKCRPYLRTFMRWLANTGCEMLIWSSATMKSILHLAQPLGFGVEAGGYGEVEEGMPRLLGVWSRSELGLTAQQFAMRVQTRKDLSKVWAAMLQRPDGVTENGGERRWNAKNTVLLDNEAEKAALQPYNHLAIAEFDFHSIEVDDALLGAIGRLDLLRDYENVAAFVAHKGLASAGLDDERAAVERGVRACEALNIPVEQGDLSHIWVDGVKMYEQDFIRNYRLGASMSDSLPAAEVPIEGAIPMYRDARVEIW